MARRRHTSTARQSVSPHVAAIGQIGRCRITTANFDDNVLRIRFKLDPPG